MRQNLKAARKAAGLTQQETADKLGITMTYYQMLESGRRDGMFRVWDSLEDLFGVHQRVLRESNPDIADSR